MINIKYDTELKNLKINKNNFKVSKLSNLNIACKNQICKYYHYPIQNCIFKLISVVRGNPNTWEKI